MLNLYRTRVLATLEVTKNSIKALRQQIKIKEDKYNANVKLEEKKEKEVKESEEFLANKKSIYEACANGEITLEEREELLVNLRDKKYLSEASDYEINDNSINNKERFEAIKLALYERCSNGELTVEQRESLINKAKEMILESSTNEPTKINKDHDPDKLVKDVEKATGDSMDKAVKDIKA